MVAISRAVKHFARSLMDNGQAEVDGVKLITTEALIGDEARRFILAKSYEKPERDLVKQALEPGDRVLEFGGCLGLLSLLCAKIVGAENVLCYEPNLAACEVIEANYRLNDLSPTLRKKALTVDGGDVQFFITDNLFSSSLFSRKQPGEFSTVPSDRFASVIDEWKPSVLVVDIEGAECDVLPSSDLKGVRKIILETHAKIVGKEENERLLTWLAGAGFETISASHGRVYLRRTGA